MLWGTNLAGRKKAVYRLAGLQALETALKAFPKEDHYDAVATPLLEACNRHSEEATSKVQNET